MSLPCILSHPPPWGCRRKSRNGVVNHQGLPDLSGSVGPSWCVESAIDWLGSKSAQPSVSESLDSLTHASSNNARPVESTSVRIHIPTRNTTSRMSTSRSICRRAPHVSLRRAVASDAVVHEHSICPMTDDQADAPAVTSRKHRRGPVCQAPVSACIPTNL